MFVTAMLSFFLGFAVALVLIRFGVVRRVATLVFRSLQSREQQTANQFLDSLGEVLARITDLRNLLERVALEVQRAFGAKQVFFIVSYSHRHLSAGTKHHTALPMSDVHSLESWVHESDRSVVVTSRLSVHHPIRRLLSSHRIAILLPLMHGTSIIGFMAVGERNGAEYTRAEVKTLASASKELVIAIQNVLSLHEVKELNATLQQRIDVATNELRASNAQLKHLDETKNEFISMASHQLRTPLTSVKGYISMVLEGDAGKVSAQQRKLLTEAFNSSERMVRLIADFLNVSRLQTGKFMIEKAPIDIKELVRQEAEDLNIIAKTHDLKLRVTITKKPLNIMADESKIRQVVMNFIDNAIYYSRPNSTIVISLDEVKGAVAFTVVDTGIGVPASEQALLFTKFFRAGNARKQRPDGTGVGLYLSRRIIHGHGGAIIFSSTEGKGSTFGFRLPLLESTKK